MRKLIALLTVLLVLTSVATPSYAATAKPAVTPTKSQTATPAANAYFAKTLRKYIKNNVVGGNISARMIDLDGDKAKEMLVYKYTPEVNNDYIYIYDYEKGKGSKTGKITVLKGVGDGTLINLSSKKSIILSLSSEAGYSTTIYTYKKLKATSISARYRDSAPTDDYQPTNPYEINNKAATKTQYDSLLKKHGVKDAVKLLAPSETQFIPNELQSIIASDKKISGSAAYKKTVYTDFINSGAYKAVINESSVSQSDDYYNNLICYALLPSDKNGNYDLLMVYAPKVSLNALRNVQIVKEMRTDSSELDVNVRYASIDIYRNVSGVMKKISSTMYNTGGSVEATFSIYRNVKTTKIAYFDTGDSNYADDGFKMGLGSGHLSSFFNLSNNTVLAEYYVYDTDKTTYYKDGKTISKAVYDKAMSDIKKDNKSFTIKYIPYGK